MRPARPPGGLRKGKWTPEEEAYANKIILLFNQGLLTVGPGTTLRSFLSEKLNWCVSHLRCCAIARCLALAVLVPGDSTTRLPLIRLAHITTSCMLNCNSPCHTPSPTHPRPPDPSDPMRITKKFAGASCIGKQVYQPSEDVDLDDLRFADEELNKLEAIFLARLNGKAGSR